MTARWKHFISRNGLTLCPNTRMNTGNFNKAYQFCPHFCKFKGIIDARIDPSQRKAGNPFAKHDCKHTIKKDVLLCEYIEGGLKLKNLIMTQTVDDKKILSVIKQVLLAMLKLRNFATCFIF